jgi:SpoIIAA-like
LNFKPLEVPHQGKPHERELSKGAWHMMETMNESAGNVVGIRAGGMLTTADYDRVLVPKLSDLSQKFETLRVLFYMDEDFRGWDLSAAWANTKLDFRFRGNLEKVAIVGAPAWEEWCVRVAGLVMKGEMRTFPADQLEDAWKLVRS